MINHRASPSRSQTSHTTDWEKKNQWCEWVHRASQLRSRITVMTCTYLVVPHHTSSLHFSSASQLSYNSSPLSTFIRQILTQKPFQYKTRGRLPTQRSTASWIQLTLQAISPCLGVAQGFGPDSSHSWGDSQPTSQLRSQAGSLEGAESEVSSKKASYLMKTCLGKSRTRTVCLRCKVHDQTSFLATESTSWSPRPVLSFHSNPIPSNAIPMQSSLKHSSSLGLQAALTKQCFPDYTLRPDAAHSQTTLPLSLPTAWQQHTEVWNGWQPAGSAEELDDGHSPRWCWYEMSLVKKWPPIPAQPAVIQKEPTETVSWAPLGIYFRLREFQRVQGTLIPGACENWLECVNQSLHSPLTPWTASLPLWKPSPISPPTFSLVTGKRMRFLQTSECPILSLHIQIKAFIHSLFPSHEYPSTWFLPSPQTALMEHYDREFSIWQVKKKISDGSHGNAANSQTCLPFILWQGLEKQEIQLQLWHSIPFAPGKPCSLYTIQGNYLQRGDNIPETCCTEQLTPSTSEAKSMKKASDCYTQIDGLCTLSLD